MLFSGCCGHSGAGYRTGGSVLVGAEYKPDQACLRAGHNSLTMKKLRQILIGAAIVISIFIVAAVCWHSVEEIHYLKTFYPKQFSVEEAFYASAVELVKVIIISLPLILVAACGIWLLCCLKKDKEQKNDPSGPR